MHTKGKWFASAQGVTENTLERKVLIAFEYGIEFGNAADDMALINAAPELLNALERIVERCNTVRPKDAFCQALKDIAIETIKQAKGLS